MSAPQPFTKAINMESVLCRSVDSPHGVSTEGQQKKFLRGPGLTFASRSISALPVHNATPNQKEDQIMQLEDALECTVTRKEAIAEIMKHDLPADEFFDDVGDRPEYRGSEVLLWLGY